MSAPQSSLSEFFDIPAKRDQFRQAVQTSYEIGAKKLTADFAAANAGLTADDGSLVEKLIRDINSLRNPRFPA